MPGSERSLQGIPTITERSQHKHTNNEPNPIEGISAALSLSDECTKETWTRDERECKGPWEDFINNRRHLLLFN